MGAWKAEAGETVLTLGKNPPAALQTKLKTASDYFTTLRMWNRTGWVERKQLLVERPWLGWRTRISWQCEMQRFTFLWSSKVSNIANKKMFFFFWGYQCSHPWMSRCWCWDLSCVFCQWLLFLLKMIAVLLEVETAKNLILSNVSHWASLKISTMHCFGCIFWVERNSFQDLAPKISLKDHDLRLAKGAWGIPDIRWEVWRFGIPLQRRWRTEVATSISQRPVQVGSSGAVREGCAVREQCKMLQEDARSMFRYIIVHWKLVIHRLLFMISNSRLDILLSLISSQTMVLDQQLSWVQNKLSFQKSRHVSFHRQTTCSGMLAATEVARNFGKAKNLRTSSRCKKTQGWIPTAKWRVLMPKRHDSSRIFDRFCEVGWFGSWSQRKMQRFHEVESGVNCKSSSEAASLSLLGKAALPSCLAEATIPALLILEYFVRPDYLDITVQQCPHFKEFWELCYFTIIFRTGECWVIPRPMCWVQVRNLRLQTFESFDFLDFVGSMWYHPLCDS